MTTTYAAAPLWSPTLAGQVENDRRARIFAGHLAQRYLVISPHDHARVLGGYPTADTEDRFSAMAWCLATLERVFREGGRMDVLLRDDGTLSPGCAQEVARWRDLGSEPRAWRLTAGGLFLIVGCP